jgi:septum formation protein
MMNLPHDLILASKSPRRQQILRDLGLNFRIETLEVDESFDDQLPSVAVAEYLAKKKNEAYRQKFTKEIIITADTTVLIGDKILNKPADRDEAEEMIRSLSGNIHKVITGVAISIPGRQDFISFSETTKVTFTRLENHEIDFYIDQFQPYDKAGAYGIQEWIGLIAIERIEGSYQNVVGLPSHRLYHELKKLA